MKKEFIAPEFEITAFVLNRDIAETSSVDETSSYVDSQDKDNEKGW